MAREPANSLDNPDCWRDLACQTFTCPFGVTDAYIEWLAAHAGLNPRLAVAMLATYASAHSWAVH